MSDTPSIDDLEAAAREAKDAYRADPSEENRAAHRAAAQALPAAREQRRGSTVVTPQPVAAQAAAAQIGG